MRPFRPLAALALSLAAAGCVPPVTQAASGVTRALADDCVKHCGVLEMRLAAVVVVAGAGGCVCEPRSTGPAPEAPRAGGAAAAGAGAYIVAAQAAAAAQQQAQMQPSALVPTMPPVPQGPSIPPSN